MTEDKAWRMIAAMNDESPRLWENDGRLALAYCEWRPNTESLTGPMWVDMDKPIRPWNLKDEPFKDHFMVGGTTLDGARTHMLVGEYIGRELVSREVSFEFSPIAKLAINKMLGLDRTR